MKRIIAFRKLSTPQNTNSAQANHSKTIIRVLSIFTLILGIWFLSPYLHWANDYPFMLAEKRRYLIAFVLVFWFFIFLLRGQSSPTKKPKPNQLVQVKIREAQQRFLGAWRFLKKTTVTKYGKSVRLVQLPWLLFIGPGRAGKTTLLANSNINFILHKQFQPQSSEPLVASEHCNWWLTRDVTILDIPSHYLMPSGRAKQQLGAAKLLLWETLLRLIKKFRGKQAMAGVVIALPLPELLIRTDHKKYQWQWHYLFASLKTLQEIFPDPIPYQFIITKADLIPGFKEFFRYATDDEMIQPWGVQISGATPETLAAALIEQLDALIKKLNQQLLWRLHQEHDPSARALIKDFPLQMERLKDVILNFFKQLDVASLHLPVHALYLTSAQQNLLAEKQQEDQAALSPYALQVCQPVALPSRAYFIKQVITHGVMHSLKWRKKPILFTSWRRRFAYAASICAIGVATYVLGYDFERGVKYSYAVQNEVATYQLAIQPVQNANEHLLKTVALLNTLADAAKKTPKKFNLATLTNFYSRKSIHHAVAVYQEAVQTVFLAELKNYFAEYLKAPVNKNAEQVYAALSAYLMLGYPERADINSISETFYQILPAEHRSVLITPLNKHFQALSRLHWKAQSLDQKVVRDTQHYFAAMPALQLATIILHHLNHNMQPSDIKSVFDDHRKILLNAEKMTMIPNMYTAKSFGRIVSHDALQAAQEAITGNWMLGNMMQPRLSIERINALTEQLRNDYLNHYIDIWEKFLSNLHLVKMDNLAQVNELLDELASNNSSLLALVRMVHENTYFEPIISASPKLQSVGMLLDKTQQNEAPLYQILAALQQFQRQIQTIVHDGNPKKAAFLFTAQHAKLATTPDVLLQLRIVATKSPEPVKHWLEKIADEAWRYLAQNASRYIDTAWQQQVVIPYQQGIANRYPFNGNSQQEVEISKFTEFFGNPGIINNFYKNYLQAFVDTSKAVWVWKSIDNMPFPLANEVLNTIQQAMRIQQVFFPNGDNQMYVQFTLQPYRFDKNIKGIQLKINGKSFNDLRADNKIQHTLTWPSEHPGNSTWVQIQLANNKMLNYQYPGMWGWFKLISHHLENTVSKKQMVINLNKTASSPAAKYYYFADGKFNPFITANFQQFNLPAQLS